MIVCAVCAFFVGVLIGEGRSDISVSVSINKYWIELNFCENRREESEQVIVHIRVATGKQEIR